MRIVESDGFGRFGVGEVMGINGRVCVGSSGVVFCYLVDI